MELNTQLIKDNENIYQLNNRIIKHLTEWVKQKGGTFFFDIDEPVRDLPHVIISHDDLLLGRPDEHHEGRAWALRVNEHDNLMFYAERITAGSFVSVKLADLDAAECVFNWYPLDWCSSNPMVHNLERIMWFLNDQGFFKRKEDPRHVEAEEREVSALRVYSTLIHDRLVKMRDEGLPFVSADYLQQPVNSAGREYNPANSLMLMMQAERCGYKTPVWFTEERIIGFNKVRDKQGACHTKPDSECVHINDGEMPFPVTLLTHVVKHIRNGKRISYIEYKNMSEDERRSYTISPFLSVFYVYNIEQTDVHLQPELYKQLTRKIVKHRFPFSFCNYLEQIAEKNEWICPIRLEDGDDSYYSISKDEIVTPKKNSELWDPEFAANLLHNMAHSTGAEQHLNRLNPGHFGMMEYSMEELTCEMAAAMMSASYRMTKKVNHDSQGYMKAWIDNVYEDFGYVKKVLTDMKQIVVFMQKHYEGYKAEHILSTNL